MLKTTLCLLLILMIIVSTPAAPRNLVILPKCASFDTLHDRFLVTCLDVGKIVAFDEDGNQRIFKDGLGAVISNHIVGDLLYISYQKAVIAVNINTGEIEKNIAIPTAQYLSGLASDSSGHLYVADNAVNGKIFIINLADDSCSLFCSGLTPRPQDLQFDAANNRLIVVGYSAGGPIQAVSLPDHAVSTIATTPCGPLDGLARDRDGNYYVSGYEARKIYRYDSNFANPVPLFTNLPGFPSNIDINAKNNILSIPYIESNLMGFVSLDLDFTADITWAWDSLAVNFTGASYSGVSAWTWHFGDGDSAFGPTVQHTYRYPGAYHVTLYGGAGDTTFQKTHQYFISVLADTVAAANVGGFPGQTVEVLIGATNNAPLEKLIIPVEYSGDLNLVYDSFSTVGCRTSLLDSCSQSFSDPSHRQLEFVLTASGFSGASLEPGSGPVLKLYFTIPATASTGTSSVKLSGFLGHPPIFVTPRFSYEPIGSENIVSIKGRCGDANGNGLVNIQDITFLIYYLYKNGPEPNLRDAADVTGNGLVNIQDITYLINFLYKNGPAPHCP